MNIQRDDSRILIKYIDSKFNCYKCTIPNSDVFVVNFCKKNLEKMEKILKNHKIIEMDEHYVLKVEDPVDLEYVLKKDSLPSMENLLVELEKYREENRNLSSTLLVKNENLTKIEEIVKERRKEIFDILDVDLSKKLEILLDDFDKKEKSSMEEIDSLKNKLVEKDNQMKVLRQKIRDNYLVTPIKIIPVGINDSSSKPKPIGYMNSSTPIFEIVWNFVEGKWVHTAPGQIDCSLDVKKGIWSETSKSLFPL